MQTLQPLATHGQQLLEEAESLSQRLTESNAALNRWSGCAKQQRMTWIDGLAYAIEQMKKDLV